MLKDAASRMAGQTLVGGLGVMAYGAALICWVSEAVASGRGSIGWLKPPARPH